MPINLEPVENSSLISAMGYDASTNTLLLRFKTTGAVHKYSDFTPEEFADFQGADSLGKHFHANIRGKKPSTKIE